MIETHRTPRRLFFAGTDTEVGKTYVAALTASLLARSRRVGVYKPVASGCIREGDERVAEDAVQLWEAAGRPRTLHEVCPQRFLAPLAPPEAAARESTQVDPELLVRGLDIWLDDCDLVIVEGAGGLFSPLANGVLNIDLVQQLECQMILVAANRLGAIHQTLSCCEASAARGVEPLGIVLCDPGGEAGEAASGNAAQIQRYTGVPVLAEVPYRGDETSLHRLQQTLDRT